MKIKDLHAYKNRADKAKSLINQKLDSNAKDVLDLLHKKKDREAIKLLKQSSDLFEKSFFLRFSPKNLKAIRDFLTEIKDKADLLFWTEGNIEIETTPQNRDIIKFLWYQYIPRFPDAILLEKNKSIIPIRSKYLNSL